MKDSRETLGVGAFYADRLALIRIVEFQGVEMKNPCEGGVENLHRDPASRRRRRKGKSQM
jgi:hypothetical protein